MTVPSAVLVAALAVLVTVAGAALALAVPVAVAVPLAAVLPVARAVTRTVAGVVAPGGGGAARQDGLAVLGDPCGAARQTLQGPPAAVAQLLAVADVTAGR